MPQFGEIRVDFITFTTGVSPSEASVTVPVSGFLRNPTFSGNVIINGDLDVYGDITNSGNYNTVNGNITTNNGTVSGNVGNFNTATVTSDALVNSIIVGRSAGSVSTNTAVGNGALAANTTGFNNTAVGYQALYSNIDGFSNTAVGHNALRLNTTGNRNTAVGKDALSSNIDGEYNTAVGHDTLRLNTSGSFNTANGRAALEVNTTGNNNTAVGYRALYSNIDGWSNTAIGRNALRLNTAGYRNTAVGRSALYYNTTGSGNIGIGFVNNVGTYAPVFDPTTENNRLVLGHTSITNAYVQVAWTVTSDARNKMNFAPVPYGLDFVNQLKPTAYQFKVDRDTETPNGDVRYGFKAQDILALEGDNPVIIDTEDADHLKYKGEHLVPVLVNAIQELTAMVKELQTEVSILKNN